MREFEHEHVTVCEAIGPFGARSVSLSIVFLPLCQPEYEDAYEYRRGDTTSLKVAL